MIEEGLIWTYYSCSNRCFLFDRIELNCNFMFVSKAMFWFGIAFLTVLFFVKIWRWFHPIQDI